MRRKLNPLRRRHRRQAPRGGGRLHRARHDPAVGDQHAARGRRRGGAPAHLVAALALALLLRHRHARPTRSCWRRTTPSRRWRGILGADSLAYISIENLKAAIGADGGFCDACFTGDYPTPVPPTAPGLLGRARAGRRPGAPGRAARGLTAWDRAAPPTPAPASTSRPATPPSTACAPWWRASADSAASSPSTPGRYAQPGPGGLDRRGRHQAGRGPGHRPLRHRRHRPGRHVRRRPGLRRRRAALHARLHRHRQGRPRPGRHRRGRASTRAAGRPAAS